MLVKLCILDFLVLLTDTTVDENKNFKIYLTHTMISCFASSPKGTYGLRCDIELQNTLLSYE